MDTMPAAWAEYASRKIEAPDGGADNSWPESLIHDEHGIKRIDPFSSMMGEVSEPMKNFLLERDLAELKQDHKQGAA